MSRGWIPHLRVRLTVLSRAYTVLMNLAEEYIDFCYSWRESYSFRAWTITFPTISIAVTTGGLLGMFYTTYTVLFSVIFTLGLCLTGVLTMIGGALFTGFWLRKRR